jgi:hypothetical protein
VKGRRRREPISDEIRRKSWVHFRNRNITIPEISGDNLCNKNVTEIKEDESNKRILIFLYLNTYKE